MNDYNDFLHQARSNLESARQSLIEEIRHYPTPISGCDAQFVHLLGERKRIEAALNSLSQDIFIPTPRQLAPRSEVATN